MYSKKLLSHIFLLFCFPCLFISSFFSIGWANPSAPVTINTITPNSYVNSSPVEVIINGSGFFPDSEVLLSGGGAYETGNCDTPGNAYDVKIIGAHAFIADGESGLQIINISDPANPKLLGSLDTSGIAQGVTVSGDYAFVADGESGLQVVDIHDPAHPELIGSYDTPGNAKEVAVSGDYAFVADGESGIQVIDIHDPSHPVYTGNFEPPSRRSADAIAIRGSHAYVLFDAIFQILDILVPSQPECVGQYYIIDAFILDIENNLDDVRKGRIAIDDYYAYVTTGDRFFIIDTNEPTNPEMVGEYNLNKISSYFPFSPFGSQTCDFYERVLGLTVAGSYAYVANLKKGLQVIDISDPTSPRWIGGYDTLGQSQGVAVIGNYAYVADGDNGLQIMDLRGLSDPCFVGSHNLGSIKISIGGSTPSGFTTTSIKFSGHDVAISGNYAYVASSFTYFDPGMYGMYPGFCLYQGLKVIDMSDSSNPASIGIYNSSEGIVDWQYPHSDSYNDFAKIVVVDNYAYLATANSLRVIDVSTPSNPKQVGNYKKINFTRFDKALYDKSFDFTISQGYAYIIDNKELKIINIKNPAGPRLTGMYKTSGEITQTESGRCGVALYGNYAYISNIHGFRVLDISNRTKPGLIFYDESESILAKGEYCRIAIEGNYAYVAGEKIGPRAIDISNPAQPVCVGRYDVPSSITEISLQGNYIFLADRENGLQVIDIRNPAHPFRIRGFSTPYPMSGLFIDDNYAYTIDFNGLNIIKITPVTSVPLTSIIYINSSSLQGNIPELLPPGGYNVIVKNQDESFGFLHSGFYSILLDYDNDGYSETDGDCDDHDATVYPGAPEICDEKDNDCDLIIPENELDNDWDDFRGCEGDCDDQDAGTYPGAPEICDGKDNDCNQVLPDNELDMDQDGYLICEGDCDDLDSHINPGEEEILCNKKDDDCSPVTEDWPLNIYSVSPDSSINASPLVITINGSGFMPDSEVRLYSRVLYQEGINNDLQLTAVASIPGNIRNVKIKGKYAYLPDINSGLRIMDIADPESPVLVGSCQLPGNAWDVDVSGAYAYVAAREEGLQVVDISNPFNPLKVGSHTSTMIDAMGITIDKNYVHLIDTQGYKTFGISNPTKPDFRVFTHITNCVTYEMIIEEGYAYLAVGERGFWVMQRRSSTDYRVVGKCYTPGDARGIAVSGNYAYVPCDSSGLQVIDITDPVKPTIVGSCNTSNIASDIAVRGSFAFIADSEDGLQIMDISDPENPIHVDSIDTPGNAWSVAVDGDYVYVADEPGGLQIIRVPSIHCPSVTYIDPFSIETTIPASLPPGDYDVMIKNPDGTSRTLSDGFSLYSEYPVEPQDSDGDGYTEAGGDCNDSDSTMYPSAPGTYEDKDNNCNGIIDKSEEKRTSHAPLLSTYPYILIPQYLQYNQFIGRDYYLLIPYWETAKPALFQQFPWNTDYQSVFYPQLLMQPILSGNQPWDLFSHPYRYFPYFQYWNFFSNKQP